MDLPLNHCRYDYFLISFYRSACHSSVKAVTAQTGDITTYYSFSGNVSPKTRQNLLAEQMMQISKIHFSEGDKVREGDVLITAASGQELKSRINGEIGNISVEENQQVVPGTRIMEIINYDDLEVVFKVDEYDISALEEGREAVVRIGAIDREFRGKINKLSREGQIVNGVTFFTSTIDLEPDAQIRIGMSAEVKLLDSKAEQVVILPMSVVQFDEQNSPFVLKSGEGRDIIKAKIATGINNGTHVEVKSGVNPGEEILYQRSIALEDILFPEGGKNTKVFGGIDD